MGEIGKWADVMQRDSTTCVDCSINGKCSNCGDCCNDILPLTNADINRIKQYIKKNKIKQIYHGCYVDMLLDVMCPFRDETNKKCTIYEVRPYICRIFTCHNFDQQFKTKEVLKYKKFYEAKPKKLSMKMTFFGDKKDE